MTPYQTACDGLRDAAEQMTVGAQCGAEDRAVELDSELRASAAEFSIAVLMDMCAGDADTVAFAVRALGIYATQARLEPHPAVQRTDHRPRQKEE